MERKEKKVSRKLGWNGLKLLTWRREIEKDEAGIGSRQFRHDGSWSRRVRSLTCGRRHFDESQMADVSLEQD